MPYYSFKQHIDIVAVILEQYMIINKVYLGAPEIDLVVRSIGDDVTVKNHVGVVQRRLDIGF